MQAKNIFGLAYHFIPRTLADRSSEANIARGENITKSGNTIYIMSGAMPLTDDLYALANSSDFETAYSSQLVSKFEDQELTYYYDRLKKTRTIKKTPDAIEFTHLVDGDITWYAVKLNDIDGAVTVDGVSQESMMFSDSIGVWSDTDRAVVVEATTGLSTGSTNIFKDFVVTIQDVLSDDIA